MQNPLRIGGKKEGLGMGTKKGDEKRECLRHALL
jgi:hypothetical protein